MSGHSLLGHAEPLRHALAAGRTHLEAVSASLMLCRVIHAKGGANRKSQSRYPAARSLTIVAERPLISDPPAVAPQALALPHH